MKLESIDGLAEAIKQAEYKYFGCYEFSDTQREAADKIIDVVCRYLVLIKDKGSE
jgi:hypothetical protein